MPPSSSTPASATSTTTIDPTPLITDNPTTTTRQNRVHRPYPRGASTSTSPRTALLRRTAAAGLNDQQAAIRVAAAEQIEERWAYSKPIVQLDLLWNSVLISAAVGGLIISREETTSVPLRMWVVGYMLQCVVHMISVWMEFNLRQQQHQATTSDVVDGGDRSLNHGSASPSTSTGLFSSAGSLWNDHEVVGEHLHLSDDDDENPSVPRYLESANTMFSFIWWIIGFYWISSGGSDLVEDAPYLYWQCITLMTLDVFFVIICVFFMFLLGVALCFCLPCIIAVMALTSDQEGATSEDIERLPKFNFKKSAAAAAAGTSADEVIKNQTDGEIIEESSAGGSLFEQESNASTGINLPQDDCVCAICTESYEDGCTLLRLPCNHIYHSNCVERWLHIKPLCPVCRRSILANPYQYPHSEDGEP